MLNGSKPQTIGIAGIEQSVVTTQPINNFYESFSSSLQKEASEPSTSNVISTNKCIVVTSAISNSPLVQVTASSSRTATSTPTTSTFKPSIQINETVANSPLCRAEGGTIVLDNKQYELVTGPSVQMRDLVNGSNILVNSPPSDIVKVCI